MSEQPTHGEGLATRSLNAVEVLPQSVVNIAPSSFIAFGPVATVALAGYGSWLSFIIYLQNPAAARNAGTYADDLELNEESETHSSTPGRPMISA
jgi:hypothetical protein